MLKGVGRWKKCLLCKHGTWVQVLSTYIRNLGMLAHICSPREKEEEKTGWFKFRGWGIHWQANLWKIESSWFSENLDSKIEGVCCQGWHTPETHMVERKKWLTQVVLWCPHVHTMTCIPTPHTLHTIEMENRGRYGTLSSSCMGQCIRTPIDTNVLAGVSVSVLILNVSVCRWSLQSNPMVGLSPHGWIKLLPQEYFWLWEEEIQFCSLSHCLCLSLTSTMPDLHQIIFLTFLVSIAKWISFVYKWHSVTNLKLYYLKSVKPSSKWLGSNLRRRTGGQANCKC